MSLVSLPLEILELVVKQIPYRTDLSRLSKTCKILKSVVFPRLYSHLVLKLPQKWTHLRNLERLLASPCEGFQHVTSIKITTRFSDGHDGYADGIAVNFDKEETYTGDVYVPPPSMSSQLNLIVRFLLQKIQKRQLREFIWDHGCALEDFTLECLNYTSLDTLEMSTYADTADDWDSFDMPSTKSFTLSSFDDTVCGSWIAHAITSSFSLEHLCLGAQSSAYRFYNGHYPRFHTDIDDLLNDIASSVSDILLDIGEEDRISIHYPDLTTLDFKGLNVSKLIGPGFVLLKWHCLTSLTLESCRGLEHTFKFLTEKNNSSSSQWQLRLQSFSIRHETCSHEFKKQLRRFLVSIPGLTDLSVLLETNDQLQGSDEILKRHGKSLRTLVWEERKGRRITLAPAEEHRPPMLLQIDQIASSCPDLIELGVSLDWTLLDYRKTWLWRSSCKTAQAIKSMKRLRTLNIRNLPTLNPTGIGLHEELQEGFATGILKMLDVPLRGPGSMLLSGALQLKILGIGSLFYRDVRNNLYWPNDEKLTMLHHFLRLQIYSVNVWHQSDGRRKRFVTHVESGTYEKTQADGRDVTVFKPYWMA